MRESEVVVIGAGPGGSATALGLARAGHHVLQLERASMPRPKVCGEGLMPVGVAELDRLGLRARVGGQPFYGIGYRAGDRHAVGSFPAGLYGLGLRRERFDAALAEAARDAGVTRWDGVQVVGLDPSAAGCVVRTRDAALRCRAVVVADGMRSPLRRALGLDAGPSGRRRYGLRGHFRLAEDVPQVERVLVHARGGLETYITPVGPREINVAALLEHRSARGLKGSPQAGLDRLIAGDPQLASLLAGAAATGGVATTGPLRQRARDVVADGVVLVGDAAGFLDGITGEGMSLTLRSARLAAEVLSGALRTGDLSSRALRPYATGRARAARDLTLLTRVVLAGIRHRWLARHVVGGLERDPATFRRVLGISAGRPLCSVGVGGVLAMVRG